MHKTEENAASYSRSQNRTNKANRKTLAARWNIKIRRGLEKALLNDPEADIAALLPADYTTTLQTYKSATRKPGSGPRPHDDTDVRARLSASDTCTVISEPSSELKDLLLSKHSDTAQAIITLLDDGDVIYKSVWAVSVCVLRVSDKIVVKVTDEKFATTEFGSLFYLQEHLPSLPVPRPHGLVRLGVFALLFTAFVPGIDLEQAWPRLESSQKRDISVQLNSHLASMRLLPFPAHFHLGGTQQEGCKDARRGLLVNTEPIATVEQFEDFIFAGSDTASPVYIEFLRKLTSGTESRCVFTHADIRPANIMVEQHKDGGWSIVAVIDWETSGFYPEYWESVKMTNTLTARETSDWYKYLPECASPHRYPISWLVHMLWDRDMVNS